MFYFQRGKQKFNLRIDRRCGDINFTAIVHLGRLQFHYKFDLPLLLFTRYNLNFWFFLYSHDGCKDGEEEEEIIDEVII